MEQSALAAFGCKRSAHASTLASVAHLTQHQQNQQPQASVSNEQQIHSYTCIQFSQSLLAISIAAPGCVWGEPLQP